MKPVKVKVSKLEGVAQRNPISRFVDCFIPPHCGATAHKGLTVSKQVRERKLSRSKL